jgi:hypothetical protein
MPLICLKENRLKPREHRARGSSYIRMFYQFITDPSMCMVTSYETNRGTSSWIATIAKACTELSIVI